MIYLGMVNTLIVQRIQQQTMS